MRFGFLLGITLCVFLAGCNDAAWMRKYTPPEEEATAQSYVDLLQQRKFNEIEHDLDPSVRDSKVRDKLAKMAALFPAEAPQSLKVVGVHTFSDRSRPFYGPWTVAGYLPLGAIVFLYRRWKMKIAGELNLLSAIDKELPSEGPSEPNA
jgi:hypothetical protein